MINHTFKTEYCPHCESREITRMISSLAIWDFFYCGNCDKIFDYSPKEITEKIVKKNFYSEGRFQDVKKHGKMVYMREVVREEELYKYLKDKYETKSEEVKEE